MRRILPVAKVRLQATTCTSAPAGARFWLVASGVLTSQSSILHLRLRLSRPADLLYLRNDLATIRTNLLHSSKKFRRIITAPEFVKYFGPAKPDGRGKGKRCNVFGAEDQLKVAPKIEGVDKSHKDIDLLKLKTIGVVYE